MQIKNLYKWLVSILLLYTVIGGFLLPVPRKPLLNETIRNLHVHVPMWFAMTILFTVALWHSLLYLRSGKERNDLIAKESTHTGILLGVLGLATGSLWARFTWGTWWTVDPKLNSAAAAMLTYLAYLLLRSSFTDPQQRARLSAVYSIFAYFLFIALVFVLPRLSANSLHPGNGGNPGFNAYELDGQLRLVFYPAVLAWSGLAWWITELQVRLKTIQQTE
jgi:heme exporter protein C